MVEKSCIPAVVGHSKHVSPILSNSLTILILAACIVISSAVTASCQDIDYVTSIGVPTFATNLPVENGYVNAATGNLHLEVPLGSFPQRGGKQFKVALMYDNNFQSGGIAPGFNSWSGWRLVTSVLTGTNFTEVDNGNCHEAGGGYLDSWYEDWFFYEPDGTAHAFPIKTIYYWPTQCNNFNPPVGTPNGAAYALDGSGYYMSVTDYTTATVYAPDGTRFTGLPPGVPPLVPNGVEDTNGNEYSVDSSGNPIDTLGRTVVKTTTGGTELEFNVYQYNYYDVLNSQGGTSRYTVTLEMINTTFFSGPIPVIQSIVLLTCPQFPHAS